MATAKKAAEVTIKNLEKEFNLDGRKIRARIREIGLNAPETGLSGFAPKRKYAWPSNSEELKKIRKSLQELSK